MSQIRTPHYRGQSLGNSRNICYGPNLFSPACQIVQIFCSISSLLSHLSLIHIMQLTDVEFSDQIGALVAKVQDGTLSLEEGRDQSALLYESLGLPIVELLRQFDPHHSLLKQARLTYESTQPRIPGSPRHGVGDLREETQPEREKSPVEGPTGPGDGDPHSEGGIWIFGVEPIPIDPETRAILDLQQRYIADIANARVNVMAFSGAPILPKAIWTTILEGGYVDFSKIYGSKDAAFHDQVDTVIGELTIKSGDILQKASVNTYFDWVWCWDQYQAASLIAYPRRTAEFKEYKSIVDTLFRAQSGHAHYLVIQFDRTLRQRIGGNLRIKLTDPSHHRAFDIQFFTPNGIRDTRSTTSGSGHNTSTAGSRVRTTTEVCKNWNRGECTRGVNCKYRHACGECGVTAHSSENCPRTTSANGKAIRKRDGAAKASGT